MSHNENKDLKKAFLESTFQLEGENPYGVIIRDNHFITTNDTLQKMIDRFLHDQFTVLPFRDKQKIIWMVLSPNERSLVVHYEELKNFLIPYYAQPARNDRILFKANKKGIGAYGADIFPSGYYAVVSTIANQPKIFSLLSLWLKLDERRPEISYEALTVNAFTLRNKFQKAISLQEWVNAESILKEIEQGHFLSDENIKYLRIQLYSSQGKWREIWDAEVFDLLAGFRYLPKKVHLSLLLSFYQSVLAEKDSANQYWEAFELYKTKRLRVIPLLRSQLGIEDDYAIRVFAYEAAHNNEVEKLQRYGENTNDQQTKELIHYLLAQIEGEGTEKPSTTREQLEKARNFYQEGKYEDAFLYLLDCKDSPEKVTMLAGIATMTETEETITSAYEEYRKLSDEEQQRLLKNPQSKALIFFILNWNQCAADTDIQTTETANNIPSWNEWFNKLIHFDENQMEQLEQLEQYLYDMNVQAENISWSYKKLQELSEYLVVIAVETMNTPQKKLLSTALPMFLSELITHSKFPNEKAVEIYEYTLDILLIYAKKTEDYTKFFIRMIEALLYLDIEKVHHFWDKMSNWFQIPPVDRLSSYVLEALELFIEYGLSNDKLKEVWDNWLSTVIERTSMNETRIQSWYDVGCMIGGDSYLIERLNEKITPERQKDPLLDLGEMIITIFSLREKPAQRAAERIMKRNPQLKIRVCSDDRLTNQAKSYAQLSDLSIIVTTCMSHALTYGINPYLDNEALYPRSAGETSIIEKLEDYARNNLFEAKIS
jgi:hypothetical protein